MSLDEAIQAAIDRRLQPLVERLERACERVEKGAAAGGSGDEYLTVKQAAELAKVHVTTIREWMKPGTDGEPPRLPRHEVGKGKLRVRRDEIHAAMKPRRPAGVIDIEARAAHILARRRGR